MSFLLKMFLYTIKTKSMLKKSGLMAILSLFAVTTLFAQDAPVPAKERNPLEVYGTNILRIAPLTAMDIGVGFGLSYEKLLGKDKMVGIIIPVSLILENSDILNNYNTGASDNYNTYYYFTPGVKIYPFGQRRVTYSIGPSLMLGFGSGHGTISDWDSFGNTLYSDYTKKVFRLGMLINNYLNFQITPGFNLGLEGALGIRYLDRQTYDYQSPNFPSAQNNNNGFDITGQFSMTLGYRF
jgi:hypothetical protein